MNKLFTMFAALPLLAVAACDEPTQTVSQTQAKKAASEANSLVFNKNSEIENIKRRLNLTANPGQIGFALLMNEAGQPIMYTSVKGKITSGGKRLNSSEMFRCTTNGCGVMDAPSDEGTYGSSGDYVYFWTVEDQYVQWNGKYLYSDKPFRTNVAPLVINVQ